MLILKCNKKQKKGELNNMEKTLIDKEIYEQVLKPFIDKALKHFTNIDENKVIDVFLRNVNLKNHDEVKKVCSLVLNLIENNTKK